MSNNTSNETKNISKEKKEKITIPKDQINSKDSFVPVCLNGKIYQINRGTPVEVPIEIAEILREAGYIV